MCPGVVVPANALGHDRRWNESKIGSISPSRLAERQAAWMVPDVLDRRISRGRWASPVLDTKYIPLRLSNPWAAAVQHGNLYIYYCIHVCIAAALSWGVMRLNLGDCTPEAQSAQHREWLPACCSCLSGCEEGAVSLVPMGEEQVGAPPPGTHQRPTPGPQDWASAGTNCTSCGSCPVPCPPSTSHMSRTPGPPLITHTRPGLGGSQGYQPTCQPANPARECGGDLQRVGAQLRCNIHSPCHTHVKKGRRTDKSRTA